MKGFYRMETETLKTLQRIQLQILKKVVKVCEKHDLNYYLSEGTLLGALRHGGFIPWDDDIDISMYREDYNKFLKVAQKELGENLFVQTGYTDKNYSRYITKVRLNDTKYIEYGTADIEMHHGIYIDIFPLDHVVNPSSLTVHIRALLIRLLFAVKTIKSGRRFSQDTQLKRFLRPLLRPITLLIPNELINSAFDYLATLSNSRDGDYTTNFFSAYGWKKQLVQNKIYGSGKKVAFENVYLTVPDNPEVILSRIYGDYMRLPPESERKGHEVLKVSFGDLGDLDNGEYNL